MKKKNLTILLLTISLLSFGQTEGSRDEKKAREDYDKFIGKVLNLNSNNVQTSFIFDISSSPTLKLTLPAYQSVKQQLFFTGNISSTNNYSPLVKKGKWVPDASINGTYSIFLKRTVKFYIDDFPSEKADAAALQKAINEASINNASQLNFIWLNLNVGYNYSEYTFFSEDNGLALDKRISQENYNSSFFQANINWFFYPSKAKTKWLSLNGSLGYTYKTNDNNYYSLTQINIKTTKTYTDATGSIMEVLEDETTARKGKFIKANSNAFDYNVMVLVSPTENFYIGLSLYGKTRTFQDLTSTDLGIGLSIPIQKTKDDKKTIANFTLKYDMSDVSNKLNNLTLKDKGKLGFTIGIPLTTFKAK
jgi:hypothetical protein